MLDAGALSARMWNFEGDAYRPDFDMYIDSWLGYVDPGQTLTAEATWQIGATNEPCWSNAEYDKLADEQAAQLDPAERQQSIWRMQQIMYEQTPWVVVAYPDFFEAYDTADWTGWTRVNDGNGPAFFTAGNVDTYVNLKPVTAPRRGGSGGSSTTWIVVAVIAVGGHRARGVPGCCAGAAGARSTSKHRPTVRSGAGRPLTATPVCRR